MKTFPFLAIASQLNTQCTPYLPYLRTEPLPQDIRLQPVVQGELALQAKQDNQFPTGNELVLFAVIVRKPVKKLQFHQVPDLNTLKNVFFLFILRQILVVHEPCKITIQFLVTRCSG